ncbi:hypothetical protein [Actinophytocola sp.]|uniref:hypothetical protein n=1 Tax=Actinophytocola sp. TaxID=1872138 RepID=UPI00389A44A7
MPEALEGMLRQAREGFVVMNIEHLNVYPPFARWSDGEIRTLDDGEKQIYLFGEPIEQYVATADVPDPFGSAPDVDIAPFEGHIKASIEAEPRNFDQDTWASVRAESPLPIKEVSKWSALPPLEWLLAIPVIWGLKRFAGSFLDRLGSLSAEGLASWIRNSSQRSLDAQRDRYLTISMELDGYRWVRGFVPFGPDDDETVIKEALDSAGYLAEVAGLQNEGATQNAQQIAYVFDGLEWHLAWFIRDGVAYQTRYFADHMPQPERFLGQPYLPDGVEQQEIPGDES